MKITIEGDKEEVIDTIMRLNDIHKIHHYMPPPEINLGRLPQDDDGEEEGESALTVSADCRTPNKER